jgi:hypothetical protein
MTTDIQGGRREVQSCRLTGEGGGGGGVSAGFAWERGAAHPIVRLQQRLHSQLRVDGKDCLAHRCRRRKTPGQRMRCC